MRTAIALARKGQGCVSPNPLVGALVVKTGKIVGRGFHQDFGGPHAEVHALDQAGSKAKGATLYLSLEPCSSYGKTPPCIEKILNVGIKRVVVATRDPNPRHAGKGLDILRKRGLQVTEGIEEEKAKVLIHYFGYWIGKKEPYVIVKEAMSLDGKIATHTGDSKWISSETSRKWVHQLRGEVDAVLVGKRTVLQDNPKLTCRLPQWPGDQPLRFVFCSDGKIQTDLKLFSEKEKGYTFVVVSKKISLKQRTLLERQGIPLILVPEKKGKIDVKKFLQAIGEMGVTSLLVEGGGETVATFFEAKKVNKLVTFVAPKIVGGRHAPTLVEGEGVSKISQALQPKQWSQKRSGQDLLIEAIF